MPLAFLIDTMMMARPFGGPNFFLSDLARHLHGRGWGVEVVVQRGPDRRLCDALSRHGIEVHDRLWKPWQLPEKKAAQLAAWVHRRAPDVFVISNCRDTAWLALPLLQERVRTVSIAHHDVAAYYDPVRHYSRYIDLAVGVSPQIRDRLAALPGVDPGRCHYIPYGVTVMTDDRTTAKIAAAGRARLRLGYVGRVVENQKRVMSFPPLLRALAARGAPFHFSVIGDGPERPALEASFAALGLGDRVTFHGWLDGESLRGRLEELDVLVMVSESEGLPIAMLEAMGHGVVPVVSDVGSGMSTVVEDGRNGFLVPFGDLATYADRIESLAKDTSRLRALQRASWETAQRYTGVRMADAYEAAFSRLLDPTAHRPYRPAPGAFPPMKSCVSRYPSWLRVLKSRVRHARAAGVSG